MIAALPVRLFTRGISPTDICCVFFLFKTAQSRRNFVQLLLTGNAFIMHCRGVFAKQKSKWILNAWKFVCKPPVCVWCYSLQSFTDDTTSSYSLIMGVVYWNGLRFLLPFLLKSHITLRREDFWQLVLERWERLRTESFLISCNWYLLRICYC